MVKLVSIGKFGDKDVASPMTKPFQVLRTLWSLGPRPGARCFGPADPLMSFANGKSTFLDLADPGRAFTPTMVIRWP